MKKRVDMEKDFRKKGNSSVEVRGDRQRESGGFLFLSFHLAFFFNLWKPILGYMGYFR